MPGVGFRRFGGHVAVGGVWPCTSCRVRTRGRPSAWYLAASCCRAASMAASCSTAAAADRPWVEGRACGGVASVAVADVAAVCREGSKGLLANTGVNEPGCAAVLTGAGGSAAAAACRAWILSSSRCWSRRISSWFGRLDIQSTRVMLQRGWCRPAVPGLLRLGPFAAPFCPFLLPSLSWDQYTARVTHVLRC
jgi:hypothetical protein